jgi:hypothetical protein
MNDDTTAGEQESPTDDETAWQRKRRLAAVFGDVLPDITSDEQETDALEKNDETQDRWLRRQVPPHHG